MVGGGPPGSWPRMRHSGSERRSLVKEKTSLFFFLSLKNTVWDVLFYCKIIDCVAEINRITLTLCFVIQRDRPITDLVEIKRRERAGLARMQEGGSP